MKIFLYIIAGLIFSISLLALIPFVLYWLSQFVYFIGELFDTYCSYLAHYFEQDFVEMIASFSVVFFILSFLAFIFALIEIFSELPDRAS
ncbi:hypothetical protein [Acinetobacter radioresistens]|jgi:hypothetical protein|uniref:hypothetical protein n=1 Tax=Acinetobacter radioresistens TaxID=40216 RepID=UPI00200541F4|nr:hypothetical protein [Acinetobacter radioresistens]MCK4079193.1 hypothetical protein [Acinetobacter radioresistens]MCK4085415.1 hypothetical protein [Acinetobacter radioresistens]